MSQSGPTPTPHMHACIQAVHAFFAAEYMHTVLYTYKLWTPSLPLHTACRLRNVTIRSSTHPNDPWGLSEQVRSAGALGSLCGPGVCTPCCLLCVCSCVASIDHCGLWEQVCVCVCVKRAM